MQKLLKEELVLIVSTVKWITLAIIVGIIVGISTAIFLKILTYCINVTNSYNHYYLLLPVALVICGIIVRYLAPDAEGHGTEKVIEAIHRRSGKIKAIVVPIKLITTVITIASGGSGGKEGPCAQIGAGLSSLFADILRLHDKDRKKLVICGISAGFASVFGTPIAGAIFGIEVVYIGSLLYDILLPSFVSGLISYHVTSSLGITYFYHPLKFSFAFNEYFLIMVILSGVFFGFCSLIFIETMNVTEKIHNKLSLPKPIKSFIAGCVLVLLTFIFSDKYLGLGINTIVSSLEGKRVVEYAFLMKIIFTSITLHFGGSGGVVTPIFFIGATAGTLFAEVSGLDRATFASIGFVALLAGSANAPISSSILAVEMFGPNIAAYSAIACIISFVITGHRSIYPSQVLAIRKSESIDVEIGEEIEDIKPLIKPREKSILQLLINISQWIKKKKK